MLHGNTEKLVSVLKDTILEMEEANCSSPQVVGFLEDNKLIDVNHLRSFMGGISDNLTSHLSCLESDIKKSRLQEEKKQHTDKVKMLNEKLKRLRENTLEVKKASQEKQNELVVIKDTMSEHLIKMNKHLFV